MQRQADERELLDAWRNRERQAGRRLVDHHLAALGRFFANKVGRQDEARELVAQTFERFAGGQDRFRGDSSLQTFLFAIAHNVLRQFMRRRQRKSARTAPLVTVADLGPSPWAVYAEHDEQRLLLRALRSLPLEQQVVLELSFFEDLSRAEVAEVAGISAGTIASRLRRAKQMLQEAIESLSESPELMHSTTTDLASWTRSLRQTPTGPAEHAP